MRKLVTQFSLRLGLELSGGENCTGLRPILSDCKVRNPQNLAGSVPKSPLIQQHCTEVRSEATSPPLTKGDLGGMSILVSRKKESIFSTPFFVIPLGLEPKTYSLEGCCSIQLSYGTILRGKISLFFRLIKLFRPLYGQQCRQAPLSPNTTPCKSANYCNPHPSPI